MLFESDANLLFKSGFRLGPYNPFDSLFTILETISSFISIRLKSPSSGLIAILVLSIPFTVEVDSAIPLFSGMLTLSGATSIRGLASRGLEVSFGSKAVSISLEANDSLPPFQGF
jgi:hypothetical protein